MRKILLLSLLSLLAFAACKKEAPKYQINGTIVGEMNGKTVYLKQLDQMRPGTAVDSAIIENGVFTLNGSVAAPDMYNISVNGERLGTNLFVENLPIAVTLDASDPKNTKATGSPLNDLYETYLAEVRDNHQAKVQVLSKRAEEMQAAQPDGKLTPEMEKQLDDEYEQIMTGYKAFQQKFIADNPNNIVSAYIFRTLSSTLTAEEVESTLSKFDETTSKSYFITSVKEELEYMKKTAEGQKFIDFASSTPDGEPIALSNYAGKGKYVLVDFWASWCGPCRKENPHVVALYDKYKNLDFEIVGVSLDRSKDEWVKGIAEDKITWPQMSDLKAWESEAVKLYLIKGIPATVLLDKEGVIIAKNLRGAELEAKLAELLGAK